MSHRFRTVVELGGKTATGFAVPADVVTALGSGRRPAVRVTVGGHTYRSTVAVHGERYLLPLSAANRSAAGVAAGDGIEVVVELDTEERTVDVPDDLAVALAARAGARTAFDALSHSQRRRHTESVTAAKRPETRERRITAIVAELGRDAGPEPPGDPSPV